MVFCLQLEYVTCPLAFVCVCVVYHLCAFVCVTWFHAVIALGLGGFGGFFHPFMKNVVSCKPVPYSKFLALR